ncbi:MAG: SurA N-terminal domain-containing protein [Pseudomonadota bacterium]
MFDFVHEKKRLVQIVLLLIILPFAFWGVESYRNTNGGGEPLATVNGEKIHQQEFDRALRQQQNRMREMMAEKFDPAIVEKPEFQNAVLQNLISQKLLMQQAKAEGLSVSEDQLAEVIAGIEAFHKDGKFDKQQYVAALKNQDMTPPAFEKGLMQELGMQQLTDAYTQNGYASNAAADNLIRLNEQQRMVSLAVIPPDAFLKQSTVEDTAVKNYYEKNQAEFQTPEQARVEYVMLSADALQAQAKVDASAVRKYYDEHQAEMGEQEQRQAAHILISVPAQASDAERQAAKAKAEQVLQQVRQSPGKFADLAKQFSQDPGSAANGGDLGMFGRGMMAKPFEDAVFQLKPGEISGLVQTEFGYHIIKLIAVQPAKIQSFDEAKSLIEQRLKLQQANDNFTELADKFSNIVYEQSDTLKSAADLVKTPILQSPWLTKNQPGSPPWTDKALQAVFSKEVIKDKRNSAAVEIAPNTLLAVRLLEYKPASTRPLAEVSDAIRQKLQRQQALELAYKQGKTTLEQLLRGEHPAVEWKATQVLTRSQRSEEGDLVRRVFQMDVGKLPAYIGAENPQHGYTLVRLEAVKEGAAIDDAKRARYVQQLRQMTGDELFQAYLADLRKRAKISAKPLSTEDRK